jgi:hypothetical protein
MADNNKVPVSGLLMKAYKAKKIDPFKWFDLKVGKLTVKVATDAFKSTADGQPGVRLPVSYNETIAICKENDWVAPTKTIADAMYDGSKVTLVAHRLPPTAEMSSLGWTLKFHEGVTKQLASQPAKPTDLVFGAWKLWVLDPKLAKSKKKLPAVNYGFWKADGSLWQPLEAGHDANYTDYSQLFQPVDRWAKGAKGEKVDLLEHFENEEQVPKQFLDPFRG